MPIKDFEAWLICRIYLAQKILKEMKLKVGDRVKFLNDTGGGIVSEILDNNMVNVRIEEGFDIPVTVDELIIDTNENEKIERSAELTAKSGDFRGVDEHVDETWDDKILSQNLPEGVTNSIYFGMVPASDVTVYKSDIITYLINDCDYYIYYLIGCLERDSFYYCKSGMLEPNTKEHIKTFTQTELSKIKEFHFQVLFISKGIYFPLQPVDNYLDISKISLYKDKNYGENEFFNEKALILKISADGPEEKTDSLIDTQVSQIIADKEGTGNKTVKFKARTAPGIEEVDLHIHKIVDDYAGLPEGEMLRIQLDKFSNALEKAIQRRTKKIVFIHGVGNGKLKFEIRKALDTKYPDLTYQDASFKEYGFGATLVKLS